jgi:hypothetical protein
MKHTDSHFKHSDLNWTADEVVHWLMWYTDVLNENVKVSWTHLLLDHVHIHFFRQPNRPVSLANGWPTCMHAMINDFLVCYGSINHWWAHCVLAELARLLREWNYGNPGTASDIARAYEHLIIHGLGQRKEIVICDQPVVWRLCIFMYFYQSQFFVCFICERVNWFLHLCYVPDLACICFFCLAFCLNAQYSSSKITPE